MVRASVMALSWMVILALSVLQSRAVVRTGRNSAASQMSCVAVLSQVGWRIEVAAVKDGYVTREFALTITPCGTFSAAVPSPRRGVR